MEPTHAPGGSLYVTVIEGEISTRLGGAPGDTYPAGSTFTASAGEYLELGNSAAGKSRTIATALLSKGAPLTVDHAGFSSDAHSGPRDGERVLDSVSHALRPTTVYHSSLAVEPPAGAFELVHLLLELDPGVRELKSLLVDGERAALEADFVGTHLAEFMGKAATGKQVRVPYSVVYDLEGDRIKALRIYNLID